jgi:hypothetical protein
MKLWAGTNYIYYRSCKSRNAYTGGHGIIRLLLEADHGLKIKLGLAANLHISMVNREEK